MTIVEVQSGDGPMVLGFPHTGTFVPDNIFRRLTQLGQTLGDTDWHIHKLYEGLLPGATSVRALFHRYVIDANRDPDGTSLYPGENTTALVPLTDFDGHALWHKPPTEAEIPERRETYHRAYHRALEQELHRVSDIHGVAILYDCHSIRSNIPFLFEGTLPDFNIGTNHGQTCAPLIEERAVGICRRAKGYSSVLNGRFKGGWTTRHYGQPSQGVHAIQIELAQSTHLSSEMPPFAFDPQKAEPLRFHLKAILESLADAAPFLGATS